MKSLNDMLVFAEVVGKGSFTAAADAIGLPKSNISRKITRLEKALGVQLLERTTRKLSLTEIGRIYYEHCLRIREELDSADALIEHMASEPSGRLRVCTSVSVGQSLVAHCLSGFTKKYPEIDMDLRLTNRRVDLIDEGFDIVIRIGKLEDSNLVARKLCSQELQLYAAPSYIETTQRRLKKPEDLVEHQCLHMNAVANNSEWVLKNASENRVIAFDPVFACNDFRVLRQLTIDGLGISVLPDYMCKAQVKNNQLIRVLEDWHSDIVDLYALVPSRRGITPKVSVFIDYIRRYLSEEQ